MPTAAQATYEDLSTVPDGVLREWLRQFRSVGDFAPRRWMEGEYCEMAMVLTGRHHWVVVNDTRSAAVRCGLCTRGVPEGGVHLVCTRCGVRGHGECAKRAHPDKNFKLASDKKKFRYFAYERISGKVAMVEFDTSLKSCDVFGLYHGQRVVSLRGVFRSQQGTIIGVSPDKKIYVHWDGESGCEALYSGGSTTQHVTESLHRSHGLAVQGCCSSEGRNVKRKNIMINTIDEVESGGVRRDRWTENPKKKICTRCHNAFRTLTKCEECQIIIFAGREYDPPEWPAVEATDMYRLDLATHNGERGSIHGAAELGHINEIRLLVEVGNYNVNAVTWESTHSVGDNPRRTALHIAVISHLKNPGWHRSQDLRLETESTQCSVVSLLGSLGADIDVQDASGRSALHLACEFASPYPLSINTVHESQSQLHTDFVHQTHAQLWPSGVRTIVELLRLGADTSLRTVGGETPCDLIEPMLVKYPKYTKNRLLEMLQPKVKVKKRWEA